MGQNASYVSLIGSEASDCSTNLAIHSYTRGETWEPSPEPLNQGWYVAADGSLLSPGKVQVAAPCEVVRLAPVDNNTIAVVCGDGYIKSTSDRGATWVNSQAPIAGIDALTARPQGGYAATVLGTPDCAGVSIYVYDAALGDIPTQSCIIDTPVQPGSTALNESTDGFIWVWAEDQTVVFQDRMGA